MRRVLPAAAGRGRSSPTNRRCRACPCSSKSAVIGRSIEVGRGDMLRSRNPSGTVNRVRVEHDLFALKSTGPAEEQRREGRSRPHPPPREETTRSSRDIANGDRRSAPASRSRDVRSETAHEIVCGRDFRGSVNAAVPSAAAQSVQWRLTVAAPARDGLRFILDSPNRRPCRPRDSARSILVVPRPAQGKEATPPCRWTGCFR